MAGLTLLELLIAGTLFAGLLGSLVSVLDRTQGAFHSGSLAMDLEVRGNRIMRRVVSALRAADAGSLDPILAPPFSSNEIQFQLNEGFDGKRTTWSATRRIRLDPVTGEVQWTDDVGSGGARDVAWGTLGAVRIEGEAANGLDDNANGLIDEAALCFTFEDEILVIRLTMAEESRGRTVERTWETRLACRN